MNDSTQEQIATLEKQVAAQGEAISELLQFNAGLIQELGQTAHVANVAGQAVHIVMQKLEEAGLVATDGEILTDLFLITEDVAMLEDSVDYLLGIDDEETTVVQNFTINVDDDSTIDEDNIFLDIESRNEDGEPVIMFSTSRDEDGALTLVADDGPMAGTLDEVFAQIFGAPESLEDVNDDNALIRRVLEQIGEEPIATVSFNVEAEDEFEAASQLSDQMKAMAVSYQESGLLDETHAAILFNASDANFDEAFFDTLDPVAFDAVPLEGGSAIIDNSEDLTNTIFGAFLKILKDVAPNAYDEYILLMTVSFAQFN